MTSHGQCPRGGACECPRGGCFSIFRRADDVTRTMSKGGACECPRVGAFFKLMTSRGQCPRGAGAPGVPPIQIQTPPPHLAGWLATGLSLYVLGSKNRASRPTLSLMNQCAKFGYNYLLYKLYGETF